MDQLKDVIKTKWGLAIQTSFLKKLRSLTLDWTLTKTRKTYYWN